jgi:hypothetical protein
VKYKVNGKTGVLISTGFGAGWSSWCLDNDEKFVKLFDKVLVKMLLDTNGVITKDIVEYVEEKYPSDYNGGIEGLEVHFIPKGHKFFIKENDGHEQIVMYEDIDWYLS